MFIDEKAPGEIKIEPSIKTMLAWVEKQPPEKQYVYSDETGCACAQFADAIGRGAEWANRPLGALDDLFLACGKSVWRQLDHIACPWPRTFGALAERLRFEERTQ
jgi:hypothetical protein